MWNLIKIKDDLSYERDNKNSKEKLLFFWKYGVDIVNRKWGKLFCFVENLLFFIL